MKLYQKDLFRVLDVAGNDRVVRWIHMRRRIRREAKRALKKHGGNVRDAAAELGMPKSTLHEWVTGKVRV